MRPLAKRRSPREPTIALINIVFLMLVFFMVAGTLTRPLDPSVQLVETRALDGRAPAEALVVHADGRLEAAGRNIDDVAAYIAGLPPEAREMVRLMPDRALPARDLVALTRRLRDAGAQRVLLVTQRALQ